MSLLLIAAAHAVSGGTQVPRGAHPAVAAVFNGRQQACTGVLVAPDVVLTAGHCVEPPPTKVVLDRVHAGAHDGELHRVARVSRHSILDVGVVVLEQVSQVPPALLLPDCEPETGGTLMGWGAVDESGTQRSDHLRSGVVTETPCNDCDRNTILAGGSPVDSCDGDSGAPVFADTPLGQDVVWAMAIRSADGEQGCGQGGRYLSARAVAQALQDLGVAAQAAACVASLPPAPGGDLTLDLDATGFGELMLTAVDLDGDPVSWRVTSDPRHAMVVRTTLVVNGPPDPTLTLELSDGTWRVPATVTLSRPAPPRSGCQSAPVGALWGAVLVLACRRR